MEQKNSRRRDGGAIAWPTRFAPGRPVPDGPDWDLDPGAAWRFPAGGRDLGRGFDTTALE